MLKGNLMQISFNQDLAVKEIQSTIRNFKKSDGYFDDGGFLVKDRKIIIQGFWYVPQFIWDNYTYEGEIINDTTIFISRCESKMSYSYC